MADYNKIGLLVMRDGRMLLCRKRCGTSLLILPGGCVEPGERADECLKREIREELGNVDVGPAEYIGSYTDRAAGEDNKTVCIELYRAELAGEPSANSEIKELVWFGAADDRSLLSPSLRNKILPDLLTRGILPWK